MQRLLGKIVSNRFSGVGVGAGVTAIIQSSSATSVMVIVLVNAGVMTLMKATSVIMGANIGTTITGVLVALKNDYFHMAMYFLAFAGVMMGFMKKEKVKLIGGCDLHRSEPHRLPERASVKNNKKENNHGSLQERVY